MSTARDDAGEGFHADADSVLCAAALEPERLSRNRHFSLFSHPALRKAHSRAQSLRHLARLLRATAHAFDDLHLEKHGPRTHLVYRDDAISLTRRIALEPLELSLLRVLIGGAAPGADALQPSEPDHRRVHVALMALGSGFDAADAATRR